MMTTCTNFFRAFAAVLFLGWAAMPLPAAAFSGITVFGDSLSDQGNSVFLQPNPAWYYEGRWSTGPVWVEYLAAGLGLAPLSSNPGAAAGGSNFAYGGSTTGPEADISGGLIPNLQQQAGLYLSNTAGAGPDAEIGSRLFVLWSGGNDVINWVEGGPQADPAVMASNVAETLELLYAAGARNFLVPNLPPLGQKPDFRLDEDLRELGDSLASQFNEALWEELDFLEGEHGDALIFRLDVYGLVHGILADPEAYGFNNVTEGYLLAGAGDPAEFLFWDTTHPTTAGHQWIAEEAIALLIPEPSTWVLLALALPLMALSLRRFRRA